MATNTRDTERICLKYQNTSDKYVEKRMNFSKQYYRIYLARLEKMTLLLEDVIKKKWSEYDVYKLHKLNENVGNEKCVVVGTLFKDQKLKPSVLKQLSEEQQLAIQPIYKHFTNENDVLYIENELQRYQLIGNIDGKYLVTGITCALLISDVGKGKLMVHDYCFADYRPQINRPIFQEDVYLIFMSGLDLVHPENVMISIEILTNFLCGQLGDLNNIKISNIVRLIIAGNSIRNEKEKAKPSLSLTSKTPILPNTVEAIQCLDALLNKWCSIIDVDVMPGENDPTNHILPQQNLHRCMFQESRNYKSLHFVTNPYKFEINGLKIMGTSGQPITDIGRYCNIMDPVEIMENCLKWNHIAPTSPDTLGCYPYYDSDPFILDDCPHVFFAGNQDRFDTKICEGKDGQKVRLVTIPTFAKTHTGCILNLKNLDCIPISFKY